MVITESGADNDTIHEARQACSYNPSWLAKEPCMWRPQKSSGKRNRMTLESGMLRCMSVNKRRWDLQHTNKSIWKKYEHLSNVRTKNMLPTFWRYNTTDLLSQQTTHNTFVTAASFTTVRGVVVRERGGTPFRQIFWSRNGTPANIVGHRWNANTEAFWQITSYWLGWPSISLFSGPNCPQTRDMASKI